MTKYEFGFYIPRTNDNLQFIKRSKYIDCFYDACIDMQSKVQEYVKKLKGMTELNTSLSILKVKSKSIFCAITCSLNDDQQKKAYFDMMTKSLQQHILNQMTCKINHPLAIVIDLRRAEILHDINDLPDDVINHWFGSIVNLANHGSLKKDFISKNPLLNHFSQQYNLSMDLLSKNLFTYFYSNSNKNYGNQQFQVFLIPNPPKELRQALILAKISLVHSHPYFTISTL